MISAPSRQPLSSGNRFYLVGILIVLLLTSCSGGKKVTKSKTKRTGPKPKLGNLDKKAGQKATGKVDTIQWTEIDRTKDYNEAIEDLEMDKRSRYDVRMFFPFGVGQENLSNAMNESTLIGRMTQYYSGVRLALDKLSSEGVNLDVNVYDSDSGDFGKKLRECSAADVIIGPYDSDQLANAANFGRNNQIPIISPWRFSSKIGKDNPFYVQLMEGQKARYDKIIEDVKSEYRDDQVILIGRNNGRDNRYMNYMQSVGAALNNSRSKPFKEFFIEEDSLMIGETAFDSIFYHDRTTVFVLPNYSSERDEDFVYNTVRKLSGEKGLNKVVLYGMPILVESEYIKFEHYRNLNMRVCVSSFVDKNLPEVKEFRQTYYDMYNDFPSDEAYEGFDMMLFVGRQLNNFGKKFQYFAEEYEASLLQTKYDVQKVYDPDEGDRFKTIQYFQNRHLYILKFEEDSFVAY